MGEETQVCSKCGTEKPVSEYYRRTETGRARKQCKFCINNRIGKEVAKHRRRRKQKLVEFFGGKCLDCGFTGAPFYFDFDHRDPAEKLFSIGNDGAPRAWEVLLAEAMKCDLVCANCHRFRTHKQRCIGCEWCVQT